MIGFYEDYYKRKYQLFVKSIKNEGCPMHFHGEVELSFVLSGEHVAIINNQKYVLGAGDAYFCNPFDLHEFSSVDKGEHILVTVRPDEYSAALGKDDISLPNFLGDRDYNKKIYSVLNEILSSHGSLNRFEKSGYINLLIGAIIKRYGYAEKNKNDKNRLTEILRYIDENHNEHLTREKISKRFGYSPNYFSKLFRDSFNIGLTDYILNLKYQKTLIELSASPSKKHTEIILKHFANPQSFYRINRRQKGTYGELIAYHNPTE